MNGLLLWIGGVLVAVMALLFGAPYIIDWNSYRGVFEEEVSRILGRDVRVGGEMNLRLLPSPYVRFEKVRISDAGAALGEPFFRAEAFTLWLSPTPLLKGAIEASEVELDRPVLRLAVDQQGRGNWQAFKITPGALPFMPSDVILQQVRIKGGVVSLRTPGVSEPLTLSGIDGELAASSLDGPYRFRGMLDWLGSRREVRIGTSQRETDGTLRYKASVRSPDNGNTYALDGVLSELSPKGRTSGALTAKLPLATVLGGLAGRDQPTRAGRGGETIDLTAKLEGDLDGAQLTDLAFAFEQDGKPQLISGDLTASWRQGLRVETRLASRWLDLDRIVGQEGRRTQPLDTLRRLIGQASLLLPREGTSLVTFDIDQINLGGDALSGVRLALARAGGLTSIGELRAALPGNARGELRGTLGRSAPGQPPAQSREAAVADSLDTFEGELLLRGPGYQRFSAWAGTEALHSPPGDASRDAPFSLASRLRLAPDGLVLTNANVELGQSRATATVDWRWGSTPSLAIAAEGRSIDIGAFAPASLDLTQAPAAVPVKAAGTAPNRHAETGSVPLMRIAERVAAIERAVGSLQLAVRAHEFSDGSTKLGNVDFDIAVKGGKLTVAALKSTTASGVRLDLNGEIAGLADKPAGVLRGWISAGTREGVQSMMAALPTGAQTFAATALAPVSDTYLSVVLGLGVGAQSEAVTATANGTIDGRPAALDVRLEGGLARWREAPIRMALDVEGPLAARPARMLAGQATPRPGAGDAQAFSMRASGANARDLLVTARTEDQRGGTTSAAYDGKLALTADGDIELGGSLQLRAPTSSDMLALAGAPRRALGTDTAVRGSLDLDRRAGTTTLTARTIEIGGIPVYGRMALTRRGDRTRLDGELTAERLSIPGLLDLVLDGQAKPAETGSEAAASPQPWSDTAFAPGLVDGIEGQVSIRADTARLAPDLALAGAEARVSFTPGIVELQTLTGAALGGRVTARGRLERTQAGAEASLELRLTGTQIAQLADTSSRSATGEANVVLSMSAKGLGPRSLVATAIGKGEIEIRNGRIPGLAGEIVDKAAAEAIEGTDALGRVQIERIIQAERARSVLALGNRKLAVDIADGIARIAALEIANTQSTLRNVTTIDLGQLKADSEWQIVSRRPLPGSAQGQKREPLPPLGIVWTGPLGSIARAEPRLSIDQLERELSMRKLERDAEKLEELRRQDEELARQEQERQRSLENRNTSSETSPTSGAPVIQVPLPIQQKSPPPATDATAPPPRVIRPPTGPRPRDSRTLNEVFSGQQQ